MLQTKKLKLTVYVSETARDNYPETAGWKTTTNSKKSYTIQGRHYTLAEKRERFLPLCSLERIGRIAFGLFCTVFTLGFALLSATIRRSFTGREVVRILQPTVVTDPTEESEPLPEGPFDKTAYTHTPKLLAPLTGIAKPKAFTPLKQSQVAALLKLEPLLKQLRAAKGEMTAEACLMKMHFKGIPERLSGTPNQELIKAMQFILYKIHQEKNPVKQKQLLLEVAVAVEACAARTQGSVAILYTKYAAVGQFDQQIQAFILAYKEKIVDEVIYTLYPAMRNPGHAAKNRPWNQFTHMRAGYVDLLGAALGLNTAGSKDDPNRNVMITLENQEAFRKLFIEKLSVQELLKEFLIDVNGRNGQIDLRGLQEWCTPDHLGSAAYECLYDADAEYPSYSPEYKPAYEFEPFLTEKAAYLIFAKLGYIKRQK